MTNTASYRSPHAARPVQAWTQEFPARPEQVGQARKFLAAALGACPAADDAVLVASELAGNSVLHSASRRPGGAFTVRVELRHGDYVRIEVRDEGGVWSERPGPDGRAHGLAIVRALASIPGVGPEAASRGGFLARPGVSAGSGACDPAAPLAPQLIPWN